ncbi:MAG TPA: energy transducer TonB [Myxococcales bacterium]|nr:energy transducer TonB [Myxococcales bacterium]
MDHEIDVDGPMPSQAELRDFKKLLSAESKKASSRALVWGVSGAGSVLLHLLVVGLILTIPSDPIFKFVENGTPYPMLNLRIVQSAVKPAPEQEILEREKAGEASLPEKQNKPLEKTVVRKVKPPAKKAVKAKRAAKRARKTKKEGVTPKAVVASIEAPDSSMTASEDEEVVDAAPPIPEPESTADSAVGAAALDALLKGYMMSVHQRVRRSKTYPRAAVRAGIEGRVELALVIDSTGKVLECRIHKSSGAGVLDRAALNAVTRMGQLPPPPSQLNWGRRTVFVPFQYTLS